MGREQTVQGGAKAAENCALNTLANVKAALGSLDRVARIVFVSGFVNAVDGFAESPAVINGASDLLLRCLATRAAMRGPRWPSTAYPSGATAEIQVVVEVRD